MSQEKSAVFAGGCFWGMEDLFRKLDGVIDTEVGYTGGVNQDPTYQNHPGHAEALKVIYDLDVIGYRNLLDFFFRIHNPTTLNQQGNDLGSSYRSAIFYSNDDEKTLSEEFIDLVNNSGKWQHPVVTTLEPLSVFYPAEDYHQDYLEKNLGGYTCHLIRHDSYIE